MTDIVEVKRMLADRAQAVAEMLLPNGRKEAQEWRVGSTGGEKGQSLGVHLSGAKAGIWSDFTTGEGGDLLDLWVAVKGGTLGDALDAARAWLGVTRQKPYREPQNNYQRPQKPACKPIHGLALDYLREDRNLPGVVLAKYKVACSGDEIIFPYLLPDGALALAKSRKAVDGAAPKPTAANCEPILFGWQAIPENAREVVITEGEIDALSWAAYDRPAMSVPFGGGKGGKQKWIESEFDRLERFERIYISTDMDKPGEEAAEEIAGHYEARDYGRALRKVMALADLVNQFVDKHQPWQMAKSAEHEETLHYVCTALINAFRLLTLYLKPVLPHLAKRAEEFLNIAPLTWADAGHVLEADHPINPYEHLMGRIDPKMIEALVAANRESLEPAAVAPAPQRHAQHQQNTEDKVQQQSHISIDDFAKVDLRVARIANAEHVEGADKLLRLTLDLGKLGTRQVFAGIKSAYDPATLIGRLTVVVANLAPRKMKFGLSEGMVLAASDEDGEVPGLFVLSPDSGATPGMKVK